MKNLIKNIRNVLIIAFTLSALTVGFSDDPKWDVQPAVKKSVAPANPKGIDGMAAAIIEIDENGDVVSAEISKTTDDSFSDPVIEALKKWRFSPAKLEGKAVPCKIKVPFKFTS